MPKGMAVTRITPINWKPANTWPTAGVGNEKPKWENAWEKPAGLIPPQFAPKMVEPQAITQPTPIATSPAGMPPKYRTPPNQLAIMIAKQVTPITGVMNISWAGRIEMNAIDTPASVPRRAARGVIFRMMGATNPPAINTKLWMNTQVRPASHPLTGSP